MPLSLVKGDYSAYGGVWTFTDEGGGRPGSHRALDYELDIPLIGPLLKKVVARLMQDNTQRLLEAVKAQAEQSYLKQCRRIGFHLGKREATPSRISQGAFLFCC